MHALIIDDSRAMRAILNRIMAGVGFTTEQAENGQEAWNILQAGVHFDVALVDWNMPVMDGYQFVKAVRAEEEYRDLWLVMVTTESESSRVVKAMAAGANEYVMKPFTEDSLIGKLRLLGLVAA